MKQKINLCLLAILLYSAACFAQDWKAADTKNISLYPQQNDFRNTMNLSGIWKFKKDADGVGEKEQWFNGLTNALNIAVPGSYNEQLEGIRDYLGHVWYEQTAYIPKSWKGQKIYLRIGSANYAAKVWVNGQPVGKHEGGHLPFAFNIGHVVVWDAANRITIQTENILKPTRVPTGGNGNAGGMFNNNPRTNYDFFPYAGLNRAVWLYSVPENGITDITVTTGIEGTTGTVTVVLKKEGTAKTGKLKLSGGGQSAEAAFNFTGDMATAKLTVPAAHLWSTDDPFLYNLNVTVSGVKTVTDAYNLPVGIRTIAVTDKQLLLNGKPVQLRGFGKHEDFPIFGRGLAEPVMVKDYSLLKWIGANSYRTSHYPYDEEYMMMADREGILIIDEIPAVGLFFDDNEEGANIRKQQCILQINELITRDKNHPSVIMWSLANEPVPKGINFGSGKKPAADEFSLNFFRDLYKAAKQNDATRPITIVGLGGGPDEWLGMMDVVCINRYYGWYSQHGDLEAAKKLFSDELDDLFNKFHKPVLVTEFGADTYPGMHAAQPEMFTEEYQQEFIKTYLDVADTKNFVIGMHLWAFADFKTTQGIIRFGGINYKGIFTRDRKPKMAAHYLRNRWGGK